jgi:sRNA-binding carbon storage regulator CsrA
MVRAVHSASDSPAAHEQRAAQDAIAELARGTFPRTGAVTALSVEEVSFARIAAPPRRVFDGGLVLTLSSLNAKGAWCTFSEGGLSAPVELFLPLAAGETAELSLRSPRSVVRAGSLTTIELWTGETRDPATTLTLLREAGERFEVAGLSLEIGSPQEGHLQLSVRNSTLPAAVTISIVSLSSADARVGVVAPPEVRVLRSELFEELKAANTAAAQDWTSSALAALDEEER